MYRRYSPHNYIPQENNHSAAQKHNDGMCPSPGMPKRQWDEQRHNSPTQGQHSSGGKNAHAHSADGCAPSQEQNQPRREYRDATLNAGRRPGNLNFQPQREHRHTPPPPPKKKNPLLGFLPPSVYNPETKKIFGFLEAEDLLLGALILMMLENEEQENSMLVYALLYVLLGDKIDLSKFGF